MSTPRPAFEYRWDVKTGSPRKLWRAINDFLTDNRYRHRYPKYEELKFDPSAIEGTATFSRVTQSWRDDQRPLNVLQFLFGLLLCLTIILIYFGLQLIERSRAPVRYKIKIALEGEIYRARGSGTDGLSTSEVLDVVADTRIVLNGWVGRAKNDSYGKLDPTDKTDTELKSFKAECAILKRKLDNLLPQMTLIKVTTAENGLESTPTVVPLPIDTHGRMKEPQVSTDDLVCTRCKNPISSDWKNCPNCGEPLLEIVGYYCSECNGEVQDGWKVCPYCSTPLNDPE